MSVVNTDRLWQTGAGASESRDEHVVEIRPVVQGNRISAELTWFAAFGANGASHDVKAPRIYKRNQIVMDGGRLVRLSRKKDGTTDRETLTRHWSDWIDYWSVDFDFGRDGDHIFKNDWQSFRTRKSRSLELISPSRECTPGSRIVAAKVVDIFGNEATAIVEVIVGTGA